MNYEKLLMGVYGFATGGAEALARDLALNLRDRGIDVSLLATHGGHGPLSEDLMKRGFTCYIAESDKLGPLARRKRLFNIFREASPDIFHAHHFALFQYCHIPARLACSARYVVTEHTDYEFLREKTYRNAARYSTRHADACTVVHGGVYDSLCSIANVDEHKVHVIENGVDTKRFAPVPNSDYLRSELELAPDAVLLGFVGRLHQQKNVGCLIAAMRKLVDVKPSACLAVVGDGPDEDMLKRQVVDTGLTKNVLFLGRRGDIAEILPSLDVFVLPSLTEGLPLALLEAMSAGVASVATDVGAVSSILDPDSGIVIEPDDEDALASAMYSLSTSAQTRAAMGLRARKIVESRFVQSDCLDKYHVLFSGL